MTKRQNKSGGGVHTNLNGLGFENETSFSNLLNQNSNTHWLIHQPADTRHLLHIAPQTTNSSGQLVPDWTKSLTLDKNGNVEIRGNLKVNGNIEATGNLTSSGTIVATGDNNRIGDLYITKGWKGFTEKGYGEMSVQEPTGSNARIMIYGPTKAGGREVEIGEKLKTNNFTAIRGIGTDGDISLGGILYTPRWQIDSRDSHLRFNMDGNQKYVMHNTGEFWTSANGYLRSRVQNGVTWATLDR